MKLLGKKPDLSEWVLPDVFEPEKTFTEMLQDALEQTLEVIFEEEDQQAYIHFPALWDETDGEGEPPTPDPLTIHLALDSINCAVSFSLREAIDGPVALCSEDGSYLDQLPRLSHALRELANEIDAACAAGAKHSEGLL